MLTHFGGELVAGSKARLQEFMPYCRRYFEALQQAGVTPKEGTKPSGAPPLTEPAGGQPVRAANAYIFRYWLGGRFYFVCTNYCWTLCASCTCPVPPKTAS